MEQAEKEGYDIDPDDYNYTPFKSFNRRRNYLIYALSHKFDKLWSDDEKEKLRQLEVKQFRIAMALKSLSVLFLMHLRFYKRPAGRPIIFDVGLIYCAAYAFIGCNIPGVFYTWDEYEHLAKKMVQSGKMRKGTIKHGTEFLD